MKVEVDVLGSRPGRKATLEPKGLEFSVACLFIMFFAVNSLNFVGLISLLFAGRGFKNVRNC